MVTKVIKRSAPRVGFVKEQNLLLEEDHWEIAKVLSEAE